MVRTLLFHGMFCDRLRAHLSAVFPSGVVASSFAPCANSTRHAAVSPRRAACSSGVSPSPAPPPPTPPPPNPPAFEWPLKPLVLALVLTAFAFAFAEPRRSCDAAYSSAPPSRMCGCRSSAVSMVAAAEDADADEEDEEEEEDADEDAADDEDEDEDEGNVADSLLPVDAVEAVTCESSMHWCNSCPAAATHGG